MAKILVVEDENNIGEIIEINLKLAQHEVVRVTSAEDAQRVLSAKGQYFDVALLDIMLPGMNGISLCEYIRRRDDKIGIIMLSAKSQEQDKVMSLSVGADDYVTKPFGVQELTARVTALLRRLKKDFKAAANEDALQSGPFVLDLKSRMLYK
ncbi:MAG: response regulator transcription factor, partial [Oscillospiraceae bacterium]